MDLHDRKGLKLPALKIQKQKERKDIENNEKVISYIESKMLLEVEFKVLSDALLDRSKLIHEAILSLKDEESAFLKSVIPLNSKYWKKWYFNRFIYVPEKLRKKFKKSERVSIEQGMREYKEAYYNYVMKLIGRKSNDIEKKLTQFEEKHNKELNIVTPVVMYICKKCKNILFIDRFRKIKCECGKMIKTPTDTKTKHIIFFDKPLRNFLVNNYWLEYGVDYLLRKNNFETLCGYYVLGHSGKMHEIDNIAESTQDNYRIFCECKTRNIKASDVFVFGGKMMDIGCSRGYIFTTDKQVQKEIKHLARSRNITIIENVLNDAESSITSQIREL